MEYIIAVMVCSFFMVALAGAYLTVRDKQEQWEANQDYRRMQESLEEGKQNDSTRNR